MKEKKEKKKTERKLTFELVPSTCWYINLRSVLTQSCWNDISRKVRQNANGICEICGRRSKRLEAHETWEYDDKNHIQKLIKIRALCPQCHQTKHIGRAQLLGKEKQALYWYAKVNSITPSEAARDKNIAFDEYHKRSQKEWTTDISENLIKKQTGIVPRYRKQKK